MLFLPTTEEAGVIMRSFLGTKTYFVFWLERLLYLLVLVPGSAPRRTCFCSLHSRTLLSYVLLLNEHFLVVLSA